MRTREPYDWEMSMNMQRDFLLFVTLATAAATPVLAQTATPAVGPASSATHGAASIPDFSRLWYHPALPWFEPPASGPGPVTNRSRGTPAARWRYRLAGIASDQGRRKQLRPAGRRL